MKLKKLLAAALPALLLFGCVAPAEEDEETVFQVSDEDGAYYASVIEETLNSFYWRYDSGSIFYTGTYGAQIRYSFYCGLYNPWNVFPYFCTRGRY